MPEENQGIAPAVAAPIPTPAAVPDGTQPGAGGATSAPAVTDPNAAPRTDGVQKRIDELTRQRYDAERERDYWRTQVQTSRQPEPTPATPQQPKTLADFEYDEAKFQAYLFETASSRAVSAVEKKFREQQEHETKQRRVNEFRAREAKFAETVPDYRDVAHGAVSITTEMAEVIAESEDGPALAYYLGKNPQIADHIAQLSPYSAARELGRIEAKLAAEREKAKTATPVVSQAPEPPPKIEATEPAVTKDPEDMTDAEFSKWFRKRRKRG